MAELESIELAAALSDLEPNGCVAYEANGIDISADGDTVVPGASFTPHLDKVPIAFNVFDSDGKGIDVPIPYATANGDVYDVTVNSVDPYTNAKVIAICKRG